MLHENHKFFWEWDFFAQILKLSKKEWLHLASLQKYLNLNIKWEEAQKPNKNRVGIFLIIYLIL